MRWCLVIHNIPPKPAYLRNKVSSRLAAMGAVALKNSVYLLPASPEAKESFMWLAQEIESGGGRAYVGEVDFVGESVESGIVGSFMDARNKDYEPLITECNALLAALKHLPEDEKAVADMRESCRRSGEGIRKRARNIRKIDFFGASGGESLEGKLASLDAVLREQAKSKEKNSTDGKFDKRDYLNRVWVTRAGVFVDRIASAWLVRKFIDPEARFRFVESWNFQPEDGEIRFDMPGGEFTHEGEECTFETLVRRFELSSDAMITMARIIHDLDLGQGDSSCSETAGIEAILLGVVVSTADDEERLHRGHQVMEDLFNGLLSRARGK